MKNYLGKKVNEERLPRELTAMGSIMKKLQ